MANKKSMIPVCVHGTSMNLYVHFKYLFYHSPPFDYLFILIYVSMSVFMYACMHKHAQKGQWSVLVPMELRFQTSMSFLASMLGAKLGFSAAAIISNC